MGKEGQDVTNYFYRKTQQGKLPAHLHGFKRRKWEGDEENQNEEAMVDVDCLVVNETNSRFLDDGSHTHHGKRTRKLHGIPHCSDPVTLLP